jgi:hypothetical protein
MKGSESFTKTIKDHLDSVAEKDAMFAVKYKNPEKSINDCISYILDTVKKSNVNGFTDQEVFSMAMHYYIENDVKFDTNPGVERVVINHHVELTEDEKEELKKQAREKAIADELERMKKRNKPSTSQSTSQQQSLF